MTIYYNKKGEVVGTQTSSGYMSSYRNEDYERRTSKYVGDRYLPIVESGEWPETLAGGQFEVLNDLYNHFLNSQNALVKLCFKRMGIYSFGGFGSSADTEGNAATFDNDGGDMNFDSPADIKEDGLNNYLMIPINPEEITVNYQIETNSYNTIFFAELATLTGLKLRRFKISSFFPYRVTTQKKFGTEPIYRPQDYIRWITDCMDNKIILAFRAFGQLAEPLPYMKCFIESFDTTLRPNGDVRYDMVVCEYIDYRKNLDMRKFVMDGEVLIVSEKPRKRDDTKITIGDFVRVKTGIVFTDKLKMCKIGMNDLISTFFKTSPTAIAAKFLTGGSVSSGEVFNSPGQMGRNAVYNLLTPDTIMTLADLIKQTMAIDRNEIWMVVGGDYCSKNMVDLSFDLLWDVAQIDRLYKNMNVGNMSGKDIAIRSMKDNRTGWVSLDQLAKVNFAPNGGDY